MGRRWRLVHARTIITHGSKYCNKSYNESIYMETKYIFAKLSGLNNLFQFNPMLIFFDNIPNETMSLKFKRICNIYILKNMAS
jgi:hypothetical protein